MKTYQVIKLNRGTGRGEVVETVSAQSSALAIANHLQSKGDRVWIRTLAPTLPEFAPVTIVKAKGDVSSRYSIVNRPSTISGCR